MKRSTLLLATAALTVALVGCAGGSGGLGTLSPQPGTPSPSAAPSAPDITPGPASPTPGQSDAPSAPPSSDPGEKIVLRAYFLLSDGTLVPVLRQVPETDAVGRAALEGLFAGVNDAERHAGIGSAVPAGTRLLGLDISSGTATVDLSAEYESGGGSASVIARLAQVVYTLTQFPTVQRVAFEIEGRPVTVFSAEGITLDGPQTRADYEESLPAIWVDRPAWGASLGNPGRIAGSANVFEASFMVTLLDGSGRRLLEEPVMATCGSGCRGTFDITAAYDVDKAEWGTLRVWNGSARDGSPENVREYRVWLTPAG